jgi:hypothetical protein
MNAQSPIQRLRQPQFGRLLSKLLDETSAGDESARTLVPGSAMLEVWPWSLFARARGARRPASKAFQVADQISTH